MSDELSRTGASSPELRASHAERDRVVDVLRIAAGDGRLTAEELDERLEAALTARTMGELAVLTTDLPTALEEGPAGGAAIEAKEVVRIEQEGASARRDAGWVVPRRMEIHSEWGEVTLDFTEAVITYDTLRIDLDMRGGALRLVTRPGVVVDTDSLVTHYGKVKTRRPADSDAPVVLRVEVTGELRFGQVVVRPPRRLFGR
ncbi:hypothetical protein ADK57_31810 [Streptomyces sp. MMG1533]|uniref:DUF1707 SHOCT-like domain-containing protein n=1 Tax=Streptomyces sp. MMG1533 TaxID=1415546 RepID=UPI0006AED7E9|nr:DUF1707 domain-containing protein [Streptomyces sp. MMG1533]KOU59870.1 hypothetical protein ADK57_31810 [Streptomyces sp. MMG1533]